MTQCIQSGMYGVNNTDDTIINGFHSILFISEAYTLQNNTKIDGQAIFDGELVVRAEYL